jgi:putative transposase
MPTIPGRNPQVQETWTQGSTATGSIFSVSRNAKALLAKPAVPPRREVEELKTLQAMIDYIHLNPVRRGLVERSEDWEWSSARFYAGMNPVKIAMDRSLPMFQE